MSPTASAGALGRARAALMGVDEIPVEEGERAQDPGTATATGPGEVGAPWPEFMVCSTIGMPDEGGPLTAEPGAVAGAWVFGSVESAETGRTRPVYQYAIGYADDAAAIAAVERARALDCDAAIRSWAPSGMTWRVDLGPVPDSVEGFAVEAAFRYDDSSVSRTVSAVLRAGDTVLYLRFSDGPGESGVNVLLDSAAASLLAATA